MPINIYSVYVKLPNLVRLYAQIDYITYGAKVSIIFSLIFEFQRFHKEPWLVVCSFICKL